MKQFSLHDLTSNVVQRDLKKESALLVEKWDKTGLLKGLTGIKRDNMARLLENQAAELLRESNSITTGGGNLTSAGTLAGFSNIAFPIVRRVFGGLIANEIVSVQPMSLPSGLVFYLDYTYGTNVGGVSGDGTSTYTKGASLYGNPAGKLIQTSSLATGGMYDLMGKGYSKVHKSTTTLSGSSADIGAFNGVAGAWSAGATVTTVTQFSGSNAKWAGWDEDVKSALSDNVLDFCFVVLSVAALQSSLSGIDLTEVSEISLTQFPTTNGAQAWGQNFQGGTGVLNLRKLNRRGDWNGSVFSPNALGGSHVLFVVRLSDGGAVPGVATATIRGSAALADALSVDTSSGSTLTLPVFESDLGTTPAPTIPEVDIKIEAISITAQTRKLRARWTPEMAQDLNAYHSMDVEVELTQILSEQITLEIDREVLNDLLTSANGSLLYWSKIPGKIVDMTSGQEVNLTSTLGSGPSWRGINREWYETLVETMINCSNQIYRKTLRGSANFAVTSPDVCSILEATQIWNSEVDMDKNGQVGTPFTVGCQKAGTVAGRFTVYKDPYFPRNKILLGYKGGSYLESGYIYAPYVGVMVTPTIFAPEDFTPRKGIMTRYGRKVLRSDFYGVVIVLDLNVT